MTCVLLRSQGGMEHHSPQRDPKGAPHAGCSRSPAHSPSLLSQTFCPHILVLGSVLEKTLIKTGRNLLTADSLSHWAPTLIPGASRKQNPILASKGSLGYMQGSPEESHSGNYFLKLNSMVPEGGREEGNKAGDAGVRWGERSCWGLMGKPFCLNCIVHIKPTTPGAKG